MNASTKQRKIVTAAYSRPNCMFSVHRACVPSGFGWKTGGGGTGGSRGPRPPIFFWESLAHACIFRILLK